MCVCANSVLCCHPPRGGHEGMRRANSHDAGVAPNSERAIAMWQPRARAADGQPCYILPYRTDPCNEGKSRVVHGSDGPTGWVTIVAVFHGSRQVMTL